MPAGTYGPASALGRVEPTKVGYKTSYMYFETGAVVLTDCTLSAYASTPSQHKSSSQVSTRRHLITSHDGAAVASDAASRGTGASSKHHHAVRPPRVPVHSTIQDHGSLGSPNALPGSSPAILGDFLLPTAR